MNTTQVGDLAQSAVITALLRRGEKVLVPFGDGLRYDVAVDHHGKLIRIQTKTGALQDNGAITFRTNSTRIGANGRVVREDYKGQADYFGVYCPDTDGCYLVQVEECGTTLASLRIEPPQNHQVDGIRWAKDYLADVAQFG